MTRGHEQMLPYRPSVFRRGLLVVLIPGLLSSIFLLLLYQSWQSTSLLARQEQARSAEVLNLAVCFNSLITYCYDVVTLSFDELPALAEREAQDKRSFESALERARAQASRNNSEVEQKVCRYAAALSREAESLSAQMVRESFHSNIARFIRYRGLMVKGATLAEYLNKHFEAETLELHALRSSLNAMRKGLGALVSIGLPIVLLGALFSLYLFSRDIFLKVRSLASKASAFPSIPRFESKKSFVDEFGYLEQALAATAEEVRSSSERRQAFVQMLAHDMRSPIMATQVYVEIMQEMNFESLSEDARRMCVAVKEDLSYVHEFVTDLLITEKLECEAIELNLARVSLKKLVESAQLEVMELADGKDIAIEFDALDVQLLADPERLLQSVCCFLKATLQSARPGSIVSIETMANQSAVTLTFKVHCSPLSDEEIECLFDPFHSEGQLSSFDLRHGGFNLRIARLLVEAHRGSVGAKSGANGISALWLRVPVSASPQQELVSDRAFEQRGRSYSRRTKSGWMDLLHSSSFRNCLLIFSAAFILQSVWLVWLGARIAESDNLARQAALQADTVFSLNKLWLELVLANNRMGFYLAARDESKLALVKANLENAETLVGSLNKLFQERAEHVDTWSNVRSFVLDELSTLKAMTVPSLGERAAVDLGVLGSRIGRAGELNNRMHSLSDDEIERLAGMQTRQAAMQNKFQDVMTVALTCNLLTMVAIVWLFSRNISARLEQLVQVAKQIPSRQPILSMMAGNDEIYQVYWQMCRAALNLKDAADQRKTIMQMLADNIGKPLARVEDNLSGFATALPADVFEKSRQSLNSASDNVNRLLALVEDLLLLDELESGNLKVTKQPCSAHEIVETSISSVGAIALKKRIAIKNACPDINLNADRKRLVQVLVNLLGNAIKFSPHDSEIVVEGSLVNEQLKLAVIDEGPGISGEDLERIFARFYQREEHKKQGFGLGLSICSLIVRSHGGEISAESEPGRGSKFILTLPLA